MSLGLESGTVRLIAYDPAWATLFVLEAKRIRAVLGPGLPLALEHVGSTAVPGLVAKPGKSPSCGASWRIRSVASTRNERPRPRYFSGFVDAEACDVARA